MNNSSNLILKDKIRSLANTAFQRHLISGYGEGEFPNKYQIVYQGKPRHFSLDHAFVFLKMLVDFGSNLPSDPVSAVKN